jgi:hypothetical protein
MVWLALTTSRILLDSVGLLRLIIEYDKIVYHISKGSLMAKGGKRPGAGRKSRGERVAVLVRLDPDLRARIEAQRNGRSMSSTVERLLRTSVKNPISDDEEANAALGYVLAQAANASGWKDRTWRNDPATLLALKQAIPLIIDLLAGAEEPTLDQKPHPFFNSADEHARQIFFWTLNRLKERGDEYGTDWPGGHPLRMFPKAAADLNFKLTAHGSAK